MDDFAGDSSNAGTKVPFLDLQDHGVPDISQNDGFLKATVDELSFSTSLAQDEVLGVLKTLQTFHPPGLAARDMRECLMLQLERAGREETLEYRIIRDFIEELKKRNMPEMARALGVRVDQIQAAVERIAHLEPRPGREFLPD
jgi:RNA polymerase sigma-54 factor